MKKLRCKKVRHRVKESTVFDAGMVVTFRVVTGGVRSAFYFDLDACYIGVFTK